MFYNCVWSALYVVVSAKNAVPEIFVKSAVKGNVAQQAGAEMSGIELVEYAVSEPKPLSVIIAQYILPQFMLFAIYSTINFFTFCYIS
jgi:hypothetical protein